jgi:hypothetical protein
VAEGTLSVCVWELSGGYESEESNYQRLIGWFFNTLDVTVTLLPPSWYFIFGFGSVLVHTILFPAIYPLRSLLCASHISIFDV